MNPHTPTHSGQPHGSVLIVVLVICLGLVSLALVLGHSMLLAYRGEDNENAGRQAQAALLGAVQYTGAIMQNVTTPGDVPDPTTYQSAAVPVGDGAFWFIGEPAPGIVSDQPTFGLVDEASKLNLNTASVSMLELLPGMTTDLATAISTWRTAAGTSNTDASGTTTAGVSTTSGPIKQGPFESVDELGLLIGGTDPTLLAGDDTNLNHVLDAGEVSTASTLGQGQYTAGFLEYCTVHTREPNVLSDGTKRTSVKSRSAVIQLLNNLLPGRGNSVARAVTQFQGSNGVPRTYIGTGTAEVETTWGVNSVLEFCKASASVLNADELSQVTPYLSGGTGEFVMGLININTASQTVLDCLPGMTDDIAGQIVAARPVQSTGANGASPTGGSLAGATISSGSTATSQSDWTWLTAILSAHQCRAIGPYVTNRSFQMSADVAAVGRYGRGYRRARFVVDLSTGTPQVVYRRDLSMLGWALGDDVRRSLATLGQLLPTGAATP